MNEVGRRYGKSIFNANNLKDALVKIITMAAIATGVVFLSSTCQTAKANLITINATMDDFAWKTATITFADDLVNQNTQGSPIYHDLAGTFTVGNSDQTITWTDVWLNVSNDYFSDIDRYRIDVVITTNTPGYYFVASSGLIENDFGSSLNTIFTSHALEENCKGYVGDRWLGTGLLSSLNITTVPEPTSMLLFGSGMFALLNKRRFSAK